MALETAFLAFIIVFWTADATVSGYFHAVAAAAYIGIVFGPRVARPLWRAFARLWMA